MTLRCSCCSIEKDSLAFTKDAQTPSGRNRRCKECIRAENRTPEGRERRRLAREKWAAKNRSYVAEKSREWKQRNPDKVRELKRRWRQKNQDSVRDSKLRYDYGISLEELQNLIKAQGDVCGICRLPTTRFFVDHCHTTMKIRGALCLQCNSGLGFFRDSEKFLESAIHYLKSHKH